MAEQEESPKQSAARSPEYRRIFTNHFFLRFAPGDINITFSQLVDLQGLGALSTVQEEVSISMSWTQLKMLSEYTSAAVKAMEHEAGPIITTGLSVEELEKQSNEIVKGFLIRKK